MVMEDGEEVRPRTSVFSRICWAAPSAVLMAGVASVAVQQEVGSRRIEEEVLEGHFD